MTVTRHFVDVRNSDGSRRRVHYRRSGSGPPVVLIHQSARSSAEYRRLLADWAPDFTCLAPDLPGFGDSAPLPMAQPHIDDLADAVLAFLDALDLGSVGGYGTHGGAIVLMAAARRAPQRFTAIACDGHAMWTEAERADLASHYAPYRAPSAYGEHLTWLWHRVREQSWFYPWYAADHARRLPFAHDDAAVIHATVMDVMAAGASYAPGHAAILQARRDLPGPGVPMPPVMIVARDGDPLQGHIDRLGPLPADWQAHKLATEAQVWAAARGWLLRRPAAGTPTPAPPGDEGFVDVPGLGQLHWLGNPGAPTLRLHAPGGAAELTARDMLAIDLPGHGLSDGLAEAPIAIDTVIDLLVAAVADWRFTRIEAQAAAGRLAAMLANRLDLSHDPAPPVRRAGWPDLTPDRHGSHLARAWSMARAEVVFAPWDAASAANARAFDPAELDPQRLHRRVLAALRARHVPELLALIGD